MVTKLKETFQFQKSMSLAPRLTFIMNPGMLGTQTYS